MWEFIHHLLGSMHLLKSVDLLTYCHYFVTFQTSLWRVKGDYSSPNLSFHQSPLIMLWGSSPMPKWATWNCVLDCFCNGFVISCLITVSSSQEPEQEPNPLLLSFCCFLSLYHFKISGTRTRTRSSRSTIGIASERNVFPWSIGVMAGLLW